MKKVKLLKIYLYIFGIGNVVTSLLVPLVFGDAVLWHPRNLATDLMVGSVYLAMGIVMVCIARKPENHKGFIDFIVIANIFHAIVMIVFAQKPSHIYLDAGFIGLMGVIPLFIYPWGITKFLKY
jgi:hypothetical protein